MPSTRVLYGTTAFLSAFLLFVVEPLAAKQLLPALGGSSAVWLTCLVFFQTALLAGYLYAHWLSRRPQQHIHRGLIALAAAALAASLLFPPAPASSAHPILAIFATLTRTIGLPFLLLASTSPLLQTWLSRQESSEQNTAPIWYRLFALSNAGSLLALIAYPILIEPWLSLPHQRTLWAAGFLTYAALAATITTKVRGPNPAPSSQSEPSPPAATTRDRCLWFFLPLAASMQLAAVTAHLTQNIAAIPLLWVVPLAVYLATFILAFDRPGFYRRPLVVRLLAVMLAGLGYTLSKEDFSLPIGLTIAFFLAECFIACLFCHGETALLRPQRTHETTLFYLLIAAGGATGAFLVAIVFPLTFSTNYDLALAFLTTAALALAATWHDGWGQRLLWATAAVLLLALAVMLHITYSRQTLVSMRNFYGTLRVKQSVSIAQHAEMRTLLHGSIQHGTQIFSPEHSHVPTTYYARDSGIGLALRLCCTSADGTQHPRHIGVIGLGAGTLATYGQPGDRIRFYELNPQVAPIARNLFTYLRDSQAAITIIPGDARTSLAAELKSGLRQQFDVLAVDAFSGDAIPLHLLTIEALELYKKHLRPSGVLAFHVSNQYLDLAPELLLLARAAHLEARNVSSPAGEERGEFRAEWVLMTADPAFFNQPELSSYADPIAPMPLVRVWTDDYSSLLPILRPNGH